MRDGNMNYLNEKNRWFLIAIFGGGGFIFLLSAIGANPWWQLILPLLPMAIYAFWIWLQIQTKGEDPTELIDNIYFLGFIFTLVSLVVSQMSLAVLEGSEADLRYCCCNFGSALSTTLFGLIARLFLKQSMEESHSPAQLQQQYEMQTRALSKHVGAFIANLQILEKQHKTFFNESVPAMQASTKTLAELPSHFVIAFQSMSRDLAKAFNQHANELQIQLNTRTEDTAKAIEEFQKKMAEFRPPTELFREAFKEYYANLDPVLAELQKSIGSYTATAEQQKEKLELLNLAYDEFTKAISAMPAQFSPFQKLPTHFRELEVNLAACNQQLSHVPGLMEKTKNMAETASTSLGDWSTKLNAAEQGSQNLSQELVKVKDGYTENAKLVTDSTALFVNMLVQSVKEMKKEIAPEAKKGKQLATTKR